MAFAKVLPLFLVAVLSGCGPSVHTPSSPSPAAAPTAPPRTTVRATPSIPPVATGLPPLGACDASPHYGDGSEVFLYRRDHFPLRIAIAPGEAEAYVDAITKGLSAWSTASGGALGGVIVGIGLTDADITVRVGTHPIYDCQRPTTRWYGIFADPQIVAPRILHGGVIHFCPENFNASPADVDRVAKVIAHELGHGLGIAGHSDDPLDVMYGDDVAVAPAQFPFVSARDLNTLRIAYCN